MDWPGVRLARLAAVVDLLAALARSEVDEERTTTLVAEMGQ